MRSRNSLTNGLGGLRHSKSAHTAASRSVPSKDSGISYCRRERTELAFRHGGLSCFLDSCGYSYSWKQTRYIRKLLRVRRRLSIPACWADNSISNFRSISGIDIQIGPHTIELDTNLYLLCFFGEGALVYASANGAMA